MRHTEQAKRPRSRRDRAIAAAFALVGCPLVACFSVAPVVFASITIVDSGQVLAEHTTHALDGALLFVDADGARHRLVTDIHAPEITNPGDGAFHPAERAQVAAAVGALPPAFVAALDVTIFLLPYPRATCLASSADAHAIYVSPLVVANPSGSEAARVVTHELGHCAHHALLPDSDLAGWQAYASLRGIDDPARFSASSPHADRPHEIFAEDFRVLFGSALARGNGSVENSDITPPQQVAGLSAFYLDLLDSGAIVADADDSARDPKSDAFESARWIVAPQPAPRGSEVRIFWRSERAAEGAPIRAEVFDASGRLVLSIAAPSAGESFRLAGISELPAGAYWVRLLGAAQPVRILQ